MAHRYAEDDEPAAVERHRGKCGKVCYPGQASARAAVRLMQRRQRNRVYEGRLRPYPCPACRCWHVGHSDS